VLSTVTATKFQILSLFSGVFIAVGNVSQVLVDPGPLNTSIHHVLDELLLITRINVIGGVSLVVVDDVISNRDEFTDCDAVG
jgi:hypothetical protein